MAIIYRNALNRPLTNAELDANFQYLFDDIQTRFVAADFTADNISDQLNTPIQITVGEETRFQTTLELAEFNALNTWLVRDLAPSSGVPTSTDKASVVTRNSLGDFSANNITADLVGNADTATEADHAATSAALDSGFVLSVLQGGTNATTAPDARTSLLVLGTEGDEPMTGTLTLATSDVGLPSLRFNAGNEVTSGYQNGDVWFVDAGIRFRANDVSETIAKVNNETFTGTTRSLYTINSGTPVYSQVSTLDHLSDEVDTLNAAIALKANIDSPTLTGIPRAPTPTRTTNDTQIATTAHVHAHADYIAAVEADAALVAARNYTDSNVDTLNAAIALKANINSAALTGTPTAPTPASNSNDTRIATTNYTVSYVTNTISNYYTKTQIDNIQPLWGTSRKFVQSSTPVGAVNGDFWFKI